MGLYTVFEAAIGTDVPLPRIESAIWESLAAAAASSRHPWNHGTFNTVSLDGGRVAALNCRTVILRSTDHPLRTVDCHTDVRSQKILDLADCPNASWTFYDRKSKIQLRLHGLAAVIDDHRADREWKQTSLRSRSAYLSVASPGLSVESTRPPSTEDRFVSLQDSERGRQHFRIVQLRVETAEWLYLRRGGHLRMQAAYDRSGKTELAWLIP